MTEEETKNIINMSFPVYAVHSLSKNMSDTVIQVTNFENVISEIVGLNLEWEAASISQNDENETMVLTKEKSH